MKENTWKRTKTRWIQLSEEVEEKSTNSKSTKQQKDEFLDALRQNVDVDYREAVRKAKEQKYIDQHKSKSQEEK